MEPNKQEIEEELIAHDDSVRLTGTFLTTETILKTRALTVNSSEKKFLALPKYANDSDTNRLRVASAINTNDSNDMEF